MFTAVKCEDETPIILVCVIENTLFPAQQALICACSV